MQFCFPDDLFILVQCNCPEVLIAILLNVDYADVVVNTVNLDIFRFLRVTQVSSHVDIGVVLDFT
jgi:hypothetical protein